MSISRELKVGLAVLGAVVLFYAGMRFFQDVPLFGGTYHLYTEFGDAGGLSSGNAVRINGVKVGRVERIDLVSDKDQVRIDFYLREDVRVPRGTTAKTSGLSYFGNMSLALLPGPSSNPPLPEGSLVPSASAGRGFEGVIEGLQERAPRLADKLDSVLTQADVTLEDAGATFRFTRTMLGSSNSDLRRTLAAFRSSATTLDQLLQSQRTRLTSTVSNLEQFSRDLSQFSAENSDSLDLAISNLNSAMNRLDGQLTTLDTTTASLNAIMRKVNQGEGTLGLMVNDSSLYVRLDSAAGNLNHLLKAFQENPSRFLREMQLVDVF